jgi:uncharacterized protein
VSAARSSLAAVRIMTLEGPRRLRLRAMVPQTSRERTRGLIGRGALQPGEALLLERTRSIHTFGMRFPIAVALLDGQHAVRAVVRVPPRRVLLPRRGVRHILELRSDVDLRSGDRLVLAR